MALRANPGGGGLLILSVLMSWCGASNRSCSVCLSLSSSLLILLALAELALAVVIFTQGATIDRFLRQHQQELKITYVNTFYILFYVAGILLICFYFIMPETISCVVLRKTSSSRRMDC